MITVNKKEITLKYLIFLFFCLLLVFYSILCVKLYLITIKKYTKENINHLDKYDDFLSKKTQISSDIDSIIYFTNLFSEVTSDNEIELVNAIFKLKRNAVNNLENLDFIDNENKYLYHKFFSNLESTIEIKKRLKLTKLNEEVHKKALLECIEANQLIQNNP